MSTASKRHAILLVRWGSMGHQKTILQPGQVLRVGRAPSNGLAVAHDPELADEHFELAWSGRRAWMHDLKSPTGTLLEGERVADGEVLNGTWLRAGRTDFSVYLERTTPPRESEQPVPPALVAHKARALDTLRGLDGPLYAMVDAARDPRILELLHESVEPCHSLYEGPKGEALAEMAPYLVSLPDKQSWLLEALVQEGWAAGWSIFFTCRLPFLQVRRHFRKFLMVEAEGADSRFYFRFYDPRVLRVFLPTCLPESKREFFGEVERFLFSGLGGELVDIPRSVVPPS
ncbi:MAG TPA: DUF4123 domain-containing protein [Archangium sp.]|nr:DUF4123 domain-containing protein [Archangium sp.]